MKRLESTFFFCTLRTVIHATCMRTVVISFFSFLFLFSLLVKYRMSTTTEHHEYCVYHFSSPRWTRLVKSGWICHWSPCSSVNAPDWLWTQQHSQAMCAACEQRKTYVFVKFRTFSLAPPSSWYSKLNVATEGVRPEKHLTFSYYGIFFKRLHLQQQIHTMSTQPLPDSRAIHPFCHLSCEKYRMYRARLGQTHRNQSNI